MIDLTTPLENKTVKDLKVGSEVYLTGTIYTARDQAHKRLVELIDKEKELPFELSGAIIYYAGPAPAAPGKVIGSCGPTTSSRMDSYTLPLLEKGVAGMIGKGRRGKKVKEYIKKYKSIYFLAAAGCGALISNKIKEFEIVAFEDLGPEAVHKLKVEDLPLVVGIDSMGDDVYNNQNK